MKARAFAVSLTIAALAPASLLAGCGADNPARPKLTLPAADSFRAGACRDAADPILALGRLTYDRADATVQERMNDVLAAIGFVRIRTGKTYDPRLMTDLETARAALQTECVRQA